MFACVCFGLRFVCLVFALRFVSFLFGFVFVLLVLFCFLTFVYSKVLTRS